MRQFAVGRNLIAALERRLSNNTGHPTAENSTRSAIIMLIRRVQHRGPCIFLHKRGLQDFLGWMEATT
jgi:hypothetical protein